MLNLLNFLQGEYVKEATHYSEKFVNNTQLQPCVHRTQNLKDHLSVLTNNVTPFPVDPLIYP